MFSERSRNGSIDEIPLPAEVGGRLWLCGKHFIGPDHAAAITRVDADLVVCLVQEHELAGRYDAYLAWLRMAVNSSSSPAALWCPMPDLTVQADALLPTVHHIVRSLISGENVIVHCAAGIGRAGTTAAAVLIALGRDEQAALDIVADARPMAGPEVGSQRDFLRDPRLTLTS